MAELRRFYQPVDFNDALTKGGVAVPTISSTSTLTNKTLTAPTITAPVITGVGSMVTPAEVLSAADTLTAADAGRTFFLSSATEFAVTLPAPALGLEFTFIVTAAPQSASYTIVTPASAQIIAGHVLTSGFADSGSDVETTVGATTITFVDGVSVVGDRATLISDGTNWYASCICAVEAGITITG